MYSAQDFYAFIQWVHSREREPFVDMPDHDEDVDAAARVDRNKATDPYGWTSGTETRDGE